MTTVISGSAVTLAGDAASALQAVTLQQVQAFMPSGAVLPFARTTAPTGWLKCNGQLVSRATYPGLFSAIGTAFGAGDGSTTFAVPDLRGEFVRGLDDGRGVDSGRTVGGAQAPFGGTFTAVAYADDGDGTQAAYKSVSGINLGGVSIIDNYTGVNGGQTFNIPVNGGDTRPRNIAMLYCIKT